MHNEILNFEYIESIKQELIEFSDYVPTPLIKIIGYNERKAYLKKTRINFHHTYIKTDNIEKLNLLNDLESGLSTEQAEKNMIRRFILKYPEYKDILIREKRFKIEITGDYTNTYYYEDILELYHPQKKIMDIEDIKFKKAFDIIGSEVFILKKYEEDYIIVQPNKLHLKYTMGKYENTIGRFYSDLYPIYSKAFFKKILDEVDKTDKTLTIKSVTTFKDKIKSINQHTVFKTDGYFFINSKDLKQEEFFKKNEESFLNNTNQGIYEINEKGKIHYINNIFSEITGYNLKEISEIDIAGIIIEYNNFEHKNASDNEIRSKLETGELISAQSEMKILTKNKEIKWLNSNTYALYSDKGLCLRGILQDITKNKEKIINSLHLQENLKNISAFSKIAIINDNGKATYYTGELKNILETEKLSNYNGFMYLNFILEEDRKIFLNSISKLSHENPYTKFIARIKTGKGNIKYIQHYIKDLYNNPKNDSKIEILQEKVKFVKEKYYATSIVLLQDITEEIKKQQEKEELLEKITVQNSEKEILLESLHDKVKNNLQLILSFIDLEERFKENEPEAIISIIKSRVTNMAIAYEMLYNSPDLTHINIKSFFNEYSRRFIKNTSTNLIINIDSEIIIPVNILSDLSFMINELLAASLKLIDRKEKNSTISINIKINHGKLIVHFFNSGKIDKEDNRIPQLNLIMVENFVDKYNGIFKDKTDKKIEYEVTLDYENVLKQEKNK